MACGLDQANRTGYFISLTVFGDAAPNMTIAREEIFGPVVTLFTVSGLDEAISLAKDTEYGLSASICTNDVAQTHAFTTRVISGVTSVNLPTTGVELHAPFGGTTASGFGVKEQGRSALDFYTEWCTSCMKVG